MFRMSVNQNKIDSSFINSLSIPSALVSKTAKLVDSRGNVVLTKTVIAVLDRLLRDLESPESKLTPQIVTKINSVQSYLSALLEARGGEEIIPSRLTRNSIELRQNQLNNIRDLFNRAVVNHGMSPASLKGEWSYDGEKKELIGKIEKEGTSVSISRNADNRVTVKTHEMDSFPDKASFKARVVQVDSDRDRKELASSDFVQFKKGHIEGSSVQEKLQNFIKTIDSSSQDQLIKELYEKLPEQNKTGDLLGSLVTFYEVGETESDKKAAILAKRVYLSCSSTTLLTSFCHLGSAINTGTAFQDPTNFISTLEIVRDSDGIERPQITAENTRPIQVTTGLDVRYTGSIKAVCDPIIGSINETFAIDPNNE